MILCVKGLLTFVFAFADTLQDGEACFFRVGDGERFAVKRRVEEGDDLLYRLFAKGTGLQRRSVERPIERKMPAADPASAVLRRFFTFRQNHFVFV